MKKISDPEKILELRNRLLAGLAELTQYGEDHSVLVHAVSICISKEIKELQDHTSRLILNKFDSQPGKAGEWSEAIFI